MTVIASNMKLANNADINSLYLEQKVKDIYKKVAQNPGGKFHFETGRQLAERLGYPKGLLDRIPAEAINSFSGVGYYFHLANLQAGESVIDLGSGSGMDSFIASILVGDTGQVIGVDMTDEQLIKAECLRIQANINNVHYFKSYIQSTLCKDESMDVVISNGVINLAPDKSEVFHEAERLLKPGGRIVLSDIVTTGQLPENIICDSNLWTACIGGAIHINDYIGAINSAGFIVESIEDNIEYQFISENTQDAIMEYGIKSISLIARKRY